jgi:uncharacterized protein (TIGR02186 family)
MRFLALFLLIFAFESFALVANISKNNILIGLDFVGDEIMVFGNKGGEGEIVVVFKSQKVSYKVYGKQKIFGIWQNANPRVFKDIYKTYRLKSENFRGFGREDVYKDLEIGVQNVNFYNFNNVKSSLLNSDYKEAFLWHKKREGSFDEELGGVNYFSNSDIFIGSIEIPPNVKPGSYFLEVFLIFEGDVREVAIFNVKVEQVGFLLELKELARANKGIYALVCVFASIVIAFLAFILAKFFYYNRKR